LVSIIQSARFYKICRWQYYFITREDPIPGFYKRNTTEDLPGKICSVLTFTVVNILDKLIPSKIY
jgi:hypothetical protein